MYLIYITQYVNDIEVELINQGCQSYELKKLNLFLLMYAGIWYKWVKSKDGICCPKTWSESELRIG
jgi:hypothetical protein